MEDILRPIIIDLKPGKNITGGSKYVWNKLSNNESLFKNIQTQDIDTKDEDVNRVISGIPTPFARANMFQYAIQNIDESANTGLMAFYKALQDEWKGLISLIALDSSNIKVKPVSLVYSDNKTRKNSENLFEVAGALGNMLLENKDMWCKQEEVLDETKIPTPIIYMIYYRGQLIGGTSPEAIVFTAPKYIIHSVDNLANVYGKLTDPLNANLSESHLNVLFTYVSHIRNNLGNYQNHFKSKKKPETGELARFLDKWKSEIKQHGEEKGYFIKEQKLITNIRLFDNPYSILFNTKSVVYGKDSILSTSFIEGGVEVDPTDLLLPPDTTELIEFSYGKDFDSKKATVVYLEVNTDQGRRYFTLPLSEKALIIFQGGIDVITNRENVETENKTKLVAVIKTKNSVEVTFNLDIKGIDDVIPVARTYKFKKSIDNKNIIIWPDFVSTEWKSYYYYSEIPHSEKLGIRAVPLLADSETYSFKYKNVAPGENKPNFPQLLKMPENEVTILVKSQSKGHTLYDYEILKSEHPFKGIEFYDGNILSGYVVAKMMDKSKDGVKLENFNESKTPSRDVTVGFDFGSNNICVSYFHREDREPKLLTFKNRRKFFCGIELGSDTLPMNKAKPNEIFFFQNIETKGNEIKSMILIHEKDKIDRNRVDNEIIGGFPCFNKNIPVSNSTDNIHTLDYVTFYPEIKYNMKWAINDDENKYKEGLLKTIWLQIYAELLESESYPSKLAWAYPSAMGTDILTKYNVMWAEIVSLNPLTKTKNAISTKRGSKLSDEKALTEAEAVCNYALSSIGKINLDASTLAISFDVGGSTTDIACIAKINGEEKLIKQSSIKLAAGILADAISDSPTAIASIKDYCDGAKIFVYNMKKSMQGKAATYFLNAVLDKMASMGGNELSKFYSNLYKKGGDQLFVLNAYLTGIILFYAGQLAARITGEEKFLHINKIQFGFYGKGGKMFDWILDILGQDVKDVYFKDCFTKGFEMAQDEIQIEEDTRKYQINDENLDRLKAAGVEEFCLSFIANLNGEIFTSLQCFEDKLINTIGKPLYKKYQHIIIKFSEMETSGSSTIVYTINDEIFEKLVNEGFPKDYYEYLVGFKDKTYQKKEDFIEDTFKVLGPPIRKQYENIFIKNCQIKIEGLEQKIHGFQYDEESKITLINNGFNTEYLEYLTPINDTFFTKKEEFIDKLVSLLGRPLVSAYEKVLITSLSVTKANITKISKAPKRLANKLYTAFNQSSNKHPKAEVSFGLSVENKLKESLESYEIFGEKGFMYNNQPINPIDNITSEHFSNYDGKLKSPEKFVLLEEFLNVFNKFIDSELGYKNSNLMGKVALDLSMSNFITNLPEYLQSKGSFVAPMIILEARAYLQDVLMKEVFKK